MKHLTLIVLLQLLCIVNTHIASAKPHFIRPKPYTVITSNQIRLEINTEKIKADSVVFYSRAFSSTANDFDDLPPFLRIEAAYKQPYEVVWDCSDITDQYFHPPNLMALVYEKNKIDTVYPPNAWSMVLDRHTSPKTISINLSYKDFQIKIDGNLNEWQTSDPIITLDKDNKTALWSAWDKKGLYFGIHVRDRYLTANSKERPLNFIYPDNKTGFQRLWEDDYLELCFDRAHDHNVARDTGDCEVLVSVLGICEGNIVDDHIQQVRLWGKNIKVHVKTLGTINDFSDIDSGYVTELFIPWEDLNLPVPKAGDTIGFDFFNGNWESREGKFMLSTWSQVNVLQNDNPSEWGNMIFLKKSRISRFAVIIMIICVSVIIIALALYFAFKKTGKQDKDTMGKNMDQAIAFIQTSMRDPNLKVEHVCQHVSMNKSKFSYLFNQFTGYSFPQFLNRERIARAKQLLAESDASITEISIEVGYNSLEHFSTVFRKMEGLSPKEFRQKR
jgi:AraC-like DNA-binding protein